MAKFIEGQLSGGEEWSSLSDEMLENLVKSAKARETSSGVRLDNRYKDGTTALIDGKLFNPYFNGEEGKYQLKDLEFNLKHSDEWDKDFWVAREKA